MAWWAVIAKNEPEIKLYHGENVEVVEGTWDGEFSKGEFHDANLFMETGSKLLEPREMMLITPVYSLERLYNFIDSNFF